MNKFYLAADLNKINIGYHMFNETKIGVNGVGFWGFGVLGFLIIASS